MFFQLKCLIPQSKNQSLYLPNVNQYVSKLKNNLAFIDCDVMAKHAYGDHTLFVGEVRVAEAKKGDPLVFYGGQFTGIETDKL